MGDINPQIDLVYVCFLQGRVYDLLKNRKFHEVSAGISCVPGENHVRKSQTLKVPCTVLYRVQTPCERDISPQIDLMYSCFLEERIHSPLINKKFHEV